MSVNAKRAICYIDGLNLYHSIRALEKPQLKWLDLWALSQSLLSAEDELHAAIYFTAVADWLPDKARRHRRYIAALRERRVEAVLSRFQRIEKSCKKQLRSCAFHEEKETDVALATRVLVDALTGLVAKQIVITADSDHVPLFKQVRAVAPNSELVLAVPPGRLSRVHSLRAVASSYIEIHPARLGACLLPRSVLNAAGKTIAACPADYLYDV